MAHGGPRALGLGAVEFFADRAQLTVLKLTDGESAPPVGRADHGQEEKPLEEIRRANHAPMTERDRR